MSYYFNKYNYNIYKESDFIINKIIYINSIS